VTDDALVVQVEHLHKTYGSVVAVDDVSFHVRRGEIFGIVGPNGAGKTTTIECIEGIREAESGTLKVLGMHPVRDRYTVRQRIGVQLQQSALQPRMKVWEAIDLYSSFYDKSVPPESLLQQLDLVEKRSTAYAKLSGGQKQRLFIALALVNDPELVFLDEITTGLDPQARHSMWDLVRSIRNRGKTILLTTHFMEEAERLCDRVAVIDRGNIVALDSPENLIRSLGAENSLMFTVEGSIEVEAFEALGSVTRVVTQGGRVTVYGVGSSMVADVVGALAAKNVRYSDLRTGQPSLEDVFLKITGHEIRE
jgi:ABC-2 type transport system ATP-binding protein